MQWIYKSSAVILAALLILTACAKQPVATTCQEEIRVGIIIDKNTWEGVNQEEGYSIAADEINRSGGINGCKVSLILEPKNGSEKSTETVQGAMLDLESKNHVVAILGATSNGATKRMAAIAEYLKIPVLLSTDAADDAVPGSRWVFRVTPTNAAFANLASGLVNNYTNIINNNIAIVFEGSEFGENAAVAAGEAAIAQNLNIVAYERYATAAKEYSTLVSAIASRAPSAIYIISTNSTQARDLIEEIRRQGIPAVVIGNGSGFTTQDFLYDTDGQLAPNHRNLILTVPWAADIPTQGIGDFNQMVQDYRKRISRENVTPATMHTAQAYTALRLLADAMKRSNTKRSAQQWNDLLNPEQINPTALAALREEIVNTLRSESYETLFGQIQFDSLGLNKLEGYLVQVGSTSIDTVYPPDYGKRPPVLLAPQGSLP